MSVGDDEINVIDDQKESRVSEIAASSIRSGLADLELRTSQVLQQLENVKSLSATDDGNVDNSTNNDSVKDKKKTEEPIVASLFSDRRTPSEILKSLEYVVARASTEEVEDTDAEFPLPALDDVSHLALISHSIVAYLLHLDRQQLLRVSDNIAGDTTYWLSSLFRFPNAASSFHVDSTDALLRIIRLAIVSRCPGFLEGGAPALAQLCFYISSNTSPLRLQCVCRQLGIPLSSIRLIPVLSSGIFGAMDLAQLHRQIQTDITASRIPLLVVADVGASICGYVDNLLRMHEICKTHDIWLHAAGNGLAALACTTGPNAISSIVDSIVLSLGSWLGVPSLPIVLLHKQIQNASLINFDSDPNTSKRLNALSLWTSLQALGREAISDRIHVAFQTCNILFEITSKCDGIRVISRAPSTQSGASLVDVINKPLDISLLFDLVSPVVVFQFDGSTMISSITSKTKTDDEVSIAEDNKSLEKINNTLYFDRLNSWLGQILQRDCPNLNFEIFEHQVHGTCIRYCPLELGLGEQPPSAENLENFADNLEAHVDILRATIKHKANFIHLVERSSVLRLVNLPDWAGMGGIQFVPEGWETLLTDRAKTELNKLNIDLVDALKSTDNAFSLGEGVDGLTCVRFGMVTHETDVEELLDLVVSVGKKVQENSKVLDTMSEIVKKGIEAATADLQRETEEKLWQEGILRHVPVVGRVFNWWSPPIKESGIKGRSLNLTQGIVESTENIYKYHMQMSGLINQLPANKSPPTPMVQTPVISAEHNRAPTFSIDTNSDCVENTVEIDDSNVDNLVDTKVISEPQEVEQTANNTQLEDLKKQNSIDTQKHNINQNCNNSSENELVATTNDN